jgi:hypothetical protein
MLIESRSGRNRAAPPPKRERPAELPTSTGLETQQEVRHTYHTQETRQQQGERLVEALATAAGRGDFRAARRYWEELRRLVLARPRHEVTQLERALGLCAEHREAA